MRGRQLYLVMQSTVCSVPNVMHHFPQLMLVFGIPPLPHAPCLC